MTQTEAILKLLEERPGGVTSLDALNVVGSFRLAARIRELREAGHHIETVDENGHGRYRLVRENEQRAMWGDR